MKLNYFHFTNIYGGVTFAFTDPVLFDATTGESAVKFSVARCHPKDNFSKKLGRKIADGRFLAGQTATVLITETDLEREEDEDDNAGLLVKMLNHEIERWNKIANARQAEIQRKFERKAARALRLYEFAR